MCIRDRGRTAGTRKQYLKLKPVKWGFKIFARSGVSGMVYHFLLYGGNDTFRNIQFMDKENQFTFSSKVVIAHCHCAKALLNLL